MGIWRRLAKVLFWPSEVYQDIVRSPKVVLPLLIIVFLVTGYSSYYVANIDAKAVLAQQLEKSERVRQLPEAQKDIIINSQAKWLIYMIPVGALVGTPVIFLIIGLYFFLLAKLSTAEVNYSQAFAIPVYAHAVAIPTVIVGFIILLATDFTTTPLEEIIPSNAGYFFQLEDVGSKLHKLLVSLDFFGMWKLVLMTIGFSVSTRFALWKSILAIFGPWLILTALTILFA
ncbi:YIP1 family protein [candidate division CSSED10-310 bacterium]|uniref:YIP1 family protein n=1 Tax=candidate division CSSED10-310 bacterium TaxID=2855610 RepID=A0ABV6Z4E5_UNCC1